MARFSFVGDMSHYLCLPLRWSRYAASKASANSSTLAKRSVGSLASARRRASLALGHETLCYLGRKCGTEAKLGPSLDKCHIPKRGLIQVLGRFRSIIP